MANKHIIHVNDNAALSLRHRAVCNEGDYKGPWRADIDDAFNDASNHMDTKPSHKVQIVTEQTMMMEFQSSKSKQSK